MKKALTCLAVILLLSVYAKATTYYVSTTGNDTSGDGSTSLPWKTLKYAVGRVAANQGHIIQLSSGTFIESGLIEVPLGVTIIGAGKDVTILKAANNFYYHPSDPGYATDKFLLSLNASASSNGNQTLKNFMIEGDSKQLHGGIYVHYRSNVTIDNVKIQNTNFTGIWLWDVSNSKLKSVYLTNCSWGSTSYSSGALNIGSLQNVEVDDLHVDENTGYGIKAIGPSGNNAISSLKIHDSRVSVAPTGLWNNGSAPNIAIELWSVVLTSCEIYNTYVDNTISLVNSNSPPANGIQSIRVHHNTLDMDTRSSGTGYAVELSIHDAEVDHNYFLKGTQGIANWDNAVRNWDIHHNVFYALQAIYPGEMVRSQWSGLHNVKFYNNTVEFASTQTMNVIGAYGGTSEDLDVWNNLFINNNTVYSYYPNSLIHLENGATLSNLLVRNNSFDRLPIGTVPGAYTSNLTSDPKIKKSGVRPDPFYQPLLGSPLIDAGIQIGTIIPPLTGLLPDIGAYEYVGINALPVVNITLPVNNAVFVTGSTVNVTANAMDTDGTISKVEFYNGATKLGEDTASPYTYSWTNVVAGNYSITAKATDNSGAVTTSAAISIIVNANKAPATNITSPAANATFNSGSTITITANASDTDGTVSKVEFYNGATKLGEDATSPYLFSWVNVTAGNYSITSKAIDNLNTSTISTSIAIVVNTNKAPSTSITSPATNATFTPGSTIAITANAIDTDGTISKVEFYNGSTKLGEDTTTPYSYSWNNVAAGNYSLTSKAIDNLNATTTSAIIAITVASPNIPPATSITSPTANATFVAVATVIINATATDSDGAITKVEFYSGSTKLGEDTTSPYSFAWSNVAAGNYSLTSRAIDNKSAVATSAQVNIIVNSNKVPTVSLAAPTANATFTTGASVTLDATATDTDGSISKVEFFNGSTKLGEDASSPYSYTWTPSVGSYSIIAKATDDKNAVTFTSAVNITVNATSSTLLLGLDSSDATLFGLMKLSSDNTADQGTYFSIPAGNGKNYYIPPQSYAEFSFSLPKTTSYVIWAKVKSLTSENQAHYIYDGKGKWVTWKAGVNTQWSWVRINDSSSGTNVLFSFTAGTNKFQMAWLDDNVQVDGIQITDDITYIPQGGSSSASESSPQPAAGTTISIYPNPATDKFTIQYTSASQQQAQVSVFDQSSNLIKRTMVDINAGPNDIVVDTDYIYNGTYIVALALTDGKKASTQLIVSR